MAGEERQWPLERFVAGIDELKTVLGADTAPVIDEVKQGLVAAVAARDNGDRDGAIAHIAGAMGGLAGLGDRLGGAEGAMMRAVARAFVAALARDDQDAIERHLKSILGRAGTPKDPK